MQGCHLTKRYKASINAYDIFMDVFRDSQHEKEAKLLKAKALYNVYINEQMQLHENAEIMTPKDLNLNFEICYQKVRELIVLLGEILDSSDVISDEINEISMMLDSAIMDYVHEANKLNEIQRCYLCRKKTLSKASHQKGIISDSNSQLADDVTKKYEDLTIEDVHSDAEGADNNFLSTLTDQLEMSCPQIKERRDNATASDKLSRKWSSSTSAISTEGSDAEQLDTPVKKHKYAVISTSQKLSAPARRRDKLIKSHLFPKAILDRFAHAVPLPNDARVINNLMPGLGIKRKYKHRLVSPRKCALYMLCSTCECTLSGHGETQFMSQFFDRLYDTNEPCKSTDKQIIQYSPELYNFCIGLIFRTLYWSKGKYTNEDELYSLLQKCRQYLLNIQSGSVPDYQGIPDIFILITPLSSEESELSYGFMNTVLSGTCLAITANSCLKTGEISSNTIFQAQYILIHMGAINILVKLTPSEDVELPMEFRINPQGGKYNIPHELRRKAYIPLGMWSLFQRLAQVNERQWLEASQGQYGHFEKKSVDQPSESIAEAYGITSGRDVEVNKISVIGLRPSPNPSIPKIINLLPDLFFVRPFQQPTLELPKGHRLLLHETAGDASSGNTVFIAVGINDASYGIDKPYVIWHYYNQGIQINFGFLITMGDSCLQAGEFLVSTDNKIRIEDFPEVMQTRSNASSVLPGVFQAKGFFHLQSLLNKVVFLRLVKDLMQCIHVALYHIIFVYIITYRQRLSVIDLKCSLVNDSQCWYCDDFCDSCLKRVSHTIKEVVSVNEKAIEIKLCSENCCKQIKKAGNDSTNSNVYYVLTPDGEVHSNQSDKCTLSQQEVLEFCGLRCASVLSDHEEIVRLYLVSLANNQLCTFSVEEILICHGNIAGQVCDYAVYNKRGLAEQPISLEFFVSQNFEPVQLLPYYNCSDEATIEAFDALKTCFNIQHKLTEAGIHLPKMPK